MTEIGALIKETRKGQGLRQRALAKLLNVSCVFISRVERGQKLLPPKHIGKTAKFLKLPKADLIAALQLDFENRIIKEACDE